MQNSSLLVLPFILALFFLGACNKTSPNPLSPEPKLLFASGFEEGVYLTEPTGEEAEQYGDYLMIKGTDIQTGFSFPISILGSPMAGLHYVDDDDHKAVEAQLQKVIGHNGDTTTALFLKENYNTGVTQFPYEILDVEEGTSDLYIKFWLKLDSVSYDQDDSWRAIFEYKTKGYAQGLGYRLIAYVYTDQAGHPYWHFQGDRNPQHPIWEIDNFDIPVPQNEWFMTEFYWHWSQGDDGISLWKINGQVVGEHHGPTTRLSQPIDFIMLFQIYGDANPKWQWIDDIEIWNTVPN